VIDTDIGRLVIDAVISVPRDAHEPIRARNERDIERSDSILVPFRCIAPVGAVTARLRKHAALLGFAEPHGPWHVTEGTGQTTPTKRRKRGRRGVHAARNL